MSLLKALLNEVKKAAVRQAKAAVRDASNSALQHAKRKLHAYAVNRTSVTKTQARLTDESVPPHHGIHIIEEDEVNDSADNANHAGSSVEVPRGRKRRRQK